jgi:hypothetical protein
MTDFTPWIRPTVLGPFLSSFGLVIAAHLLFGMQAVNALFGGHEFDALLVSLLLTGFVSAAVVVNLIVADVALLGLKWRRLPTGFSAWLGAMLAPIALHLSWAHFGWGDGESVADLVAHIVVPMPVTAVLLRLMFGQKP